MPVYYEIYTQGGVLVERGTMAEFVVGSWQAKVTFKPEWGTGFFYVRCYDTDTGAEDVMTVWVVTEDKYPAIMADFKRLMQFLMATL